ncbi:MAG: prepilin-type N-terminal cleavage/methylation domain-containing protein [Phycisphaerae bacterium]
MHSLRASCRVAGARRGLTLIELLVVIAIIALLIAILLPVLTNARASAKGAVCLASLRSIGQAVVLYCDNNEGRYPVSSHTAGSLVAPVGWLTSLQPYGVLVEARKCPMDDFRAQRSTSYATNEHFEPLTPGIDFNPVNHQPLPGGRMRAFDRMTLVPRPAATIYAYEPEGIGTIDHLNTHQFVTADDVRAGIAVTRHLGNGQYLFADGHVDKRSWSRFAAVFSPATSPFDPETAR